MEIELLFRCRVCQYVIQESVLEKFDNEKQIRQLLLLRKDEIRFHMGFEGNVDKHRGIADLIGCNIAED